MTLSIERMAAPLGVIVDGADVRDSSADAFAEWEALFLAHHVLVFRNQQLTAEQQLAFGRRWGELMRHPYAAMAEHPELIELRNRGKAKDINQHWHSDMTYEVTPPKLTMLYARETPGLGGDTAFANQILAFDALSPALRELLTSLRAVHSAVGLAGRYGADAAAAPRATHPVVRTHDESGARALYVCRAFTQRFDGWSREESAGLLETLFQHSTRPEFQARQQWRTGDLVLWDNRCLLHFAVHDHDDAPRVIHRLQVVGGTPQ